MITFSLYWSYFSLPTFSDPPSRRSFLSLYSCIDCILAFHLDCHWSLLGYLFHRCLAGGGRVGYRLWRHYSRVILSLMQQAELVLCIKCGSDECFIWKFPHSLACTSLLPSSASCFMALVVCPQNPQEHLLLGLLRWATFLGFPNWIVLTRLCLIWWIVGSYCLSGIFCPVILFLMASPSHTSHIIFLTF